MTTDKIRVTGHVGRVTSTWSVAKVTKTTTGIVQTGSVPKNQPAKEALKHAK
jgi:hypothetical protein